MKSSTMKRTVYSIAAILILVLSLCNCQSNVFSSRRITVEKPLDFWLYEPLDERYSEGDPVTVKVRCSDTVSYMLYVNGEYIAPEPRDDSGSYRQYTFTMPDKNVTLSMRMVDAVSEECIAKERILSAYLSEHPEAIDAKIAYFYGEYSGGALVSMIGSPDADTAIGEEEIPGFDIRYRNGNRITVLIGDNFYSLSESYSMGYLTEADVRDIETLHREFYENSVLEQK